MRFFRIRFKVKHMMIAVAITALMMVSLAEMQIMIPRMRYCWARANFHAVWEFRARAKASETQTRESVVRHSSYQNSRLSEVGNSNPQFRHYLGIRGRYQPTIFRASWYLQQAEYHAELRQYYKWLMWHPWLECK